MIMASVRRIVVFSGMLLILRDCEAMLPPMQSASNAVFGSGDSDRFHACLQVSFRLGDMPGVTVGDSVAKISDEDLARRAPVVLHNDVDLQSVQSIENAVIAEAKNLLRDKSLSFYVNLHKLRAHDHPGCDSPLSVFDSRPLFAKQNSRPDVAKPHPSRCHPITATIMILTPLPKRRKRDNSA